MTESDRKNGRVLGTALALSVILSVVLATLCSVQGIGLSPGALHWLPAAHISQNPWYEAGYRALLHLMGGWNRNGLPAAARWPQIALFALTVAIAGITIWRRSNHHVPAAVIVAMFLATSPQTLRLFTVLSPFSLMICLSMLSLLASEEFGRQRRKRWLIIAVLAGAAASLSARGGALAMVCSFPLAFQSGKLRTAPWPHLLFGMLLALAFLPLRAISVTVGALIVPLAIFVCSVVRNALGIWLLISLFVVQCIFAVPRIVHAERNGHDFAEKRWKHSPTIQALGRLKTHPAIYTNIPEPLLLYSHLQVSALPELESTKNSDESSLRHTLTSTDSLIVLFGDAQPQFAALNKLVPLEEYRSLPDSQIFRADVSAWTGGKRTPAFSDNTPSIPARRAAGHFDWWNQKHDGYVKQAAAGNINLLYLGDSITDDFRKVPGAWDFFQERFAKYHAANFGIDGDHTQHLLFRILNGECDHIHPRVAVILIGTNNTADDSADAIAKGIGACVAAVREKLPQTRILLLGLFPRGESATNNDKRPVILKVNREIARLDNGDTIRFLNLYDKFLAPDGTLSKQIMYDGLHPSLQGYHIWLDAMQALLEQMMRVAPTTAP